MSESAGKSDKSPSAPLQGLLLLLDIMWTLATLTAFQVPVIVRDGYVENEGAVNWAFVWSAYGIAFGCVAAYALLRKLRARVENSNYRVSWGATFSVVLSMTAPLLVSAAYVVLGEAWGKVPVSDVWAFVWSAGSALFAVVVRWLSEILLTRRPPAAPEPR